MATNVLASCSSLISSKEVSWHATPFEERLKKALSYESHLSEEPTTRHSQEYVSYVYHSLYAYFDRDNVALKGLAK
ncbi:Ferritin [Corchorus capsularis]|uniref:Ferritin n=1 Tax=Corchorus capsularis TaxID=210143 RepID=A0A1R3HT83_COCAP|nr:Ferritin [Corchorus capsularis]